MKILEDSINISNTSNLKHQKCNHSNQYVLHTTLSQRSLRYKQSTSTKPIIHNTTKTKPHHYQKNRAQTLISNTAIFPSITQPFQQCFAPFFSLKPPWICNGFGGTMAASSDPFRWKTTVPETRPIFCTPHDSLFSRLLYGISDRAFTALCSLLVSRDMCHKLEM